MSQSYPRNLVGYGAIVPYGSTVALIGGLKDNTLFKWDKVYIYDPEDDKWNPLSVGLQTARSNFAAIPVKMESVPKC